MKKGKEKQKEKEVPVPSGQAILIDSTPVPSPQARPGPSSPPYPFRSYKPPAPRPCRLPLAATPPPPLVVNRPARVSRGRKKGKERMTAPIPREWAGLQQFPSATQTKLHELLGKLKEENVSTLTILVMGKGGVGKSSTVNSIVGERVTTVSAFQSEGLRPMMCSRTRAGFTLNIIDTPGIIEGGYINEQAVEIIKRFLLGKTIDVLLYVDRLDAYRMDTLDEEVIRAITNSFGKDIWRRALVVLTHAQLSPPDGIDYNDFFTRRSEALLRYIRTGAGINRREHGDFPLPIALVENSGRCKTNEHGEKILPDGTPWVPNLMNEITVVISNGSKPIDVDQKLIDGPNPNNRWKIFIPLILAVEYFLVVKGIRRVIHADIANGKVDDWEQRYRDLVGSRDPVEQKVSASRNRKA